MENQIGWPDQLFDVLKGADIRQVGYVLDAGHARLIARCKADNDIRDVVLSTEEEGVALAAGAWLGGQRSALLMQSSGVGNCINMFSLISACRFPFLTFIDARRMGRVQSMAGADVAGDRTGAQRDGREGLSRQRRRRGGGYRAGRR